jgi:hypothetical protein
MYRSEKWLAAVRSLERCVRCGRSLKVDACHRNEGKGTGIKAPDCNTWAGCRECHIEIDQGPGMTLAQRRAESDRCIVLTHELLAECGAITCGVDNVRDAKPPRRRSKGNTASTSKNLSNYRPRVA